MQTISLKLPDELMARLATEAATRRVTRTRIVRESLERELPRPQPDPEVSCYDLAWDLIGSVEGLPADIATNPRYMDGYGE